MLVACLVFVGQGAVAQDPAQNKLDIVLKCESDDGKFSQIVNLRDDAFHLWDSDKQTFVQNDCNAKVNFVLEPTKMMRRQATEVGLKASCEITPIIYKYEYRYFEYGCEVNYDWFVNKTKLSFERILQYNCPVEKIVQSFSVDRKDGRFRWIEGVAGTDGYIKQDITGNCAVTDRPKPPATKF